MILLYLALYWLGAVFTVACAGYMFGYLAREDASEQKTKSNSGMKWVMVGVVIAVIALVLHTAVGRSLYFPSVWGPKAHLLLVPISILMGFVGWRTHRKDIARG